MYRLSLGIVALSAALTIAVVAQAQVYPPEVYYSPYPQPYYGYPQYVGPAAPGYYPGYYYYPVPSDPHTAGTGNRAYWGGQKSN